MANLLGSNICVAFLSQHRLWALGSTGQCMGATMAQCSETGILIQMTCVQIQNSGLLQGFVLGDA